MKKAKKRGKNIDVLVVPKGKMILFMAVKALCILAIIAGFLVPGRLQTLSIVMILSGFFIGLFVTYARDYYYRCPGCGECLLKKQRFLKKIKGQVPKNCPKCSWHCNIEMK